MIYCPQYLSSTDDATISSKGLSEILHIRTTKISAMAASFLSVCFPLFLQWLHLATAQNSTCGIPHIQPRSIEARVKGGVDAVAGSWPWQVRLGRRMANGQIKWMCGGSLLSDIYVITAAHCLESAVNGNYIVRVGEHDVRQPNAGQENIPVSRLRLHPSYGGQSRNFIHDIAILRLSKAVTFRSKVLPVCLPSASEDPTAGTRCIVTGWGLMGKVPAVKLQQGNVQIISRSSCATASIAASQVCAGTGDGSVDACSGDSGGPLVCQNPSTRKWILQGLVSFGPSAGCGIPRMPAVYTKVSSYVQWIKSLTTLGT